MTALILAAGALDLAWWWSVRRATPTRHPLRFVGGGLALYEILWLVGRLEPALRIPGTPGLDAANVLWHGLILPLTLGAMLTSPAWGAVRRRLWGRGRA